MYKRQSYKFTTIIGKQPSFTDIVYILNGVVSCGLIAILAFFLLGSIIPFEKAPTLISLIQTVLTLLIIGIMYAQVKIADKQTMLFELERMPIIDLDVGRDKTGKPLELITGKFYYDIINLSEFPVRILDLTCDGNKVKPYQNTIRPQKATRLDVDKKPSIIRVKVANLLEQKIKREFEYDISKDEINLVEVR